MYLAEVPVLPGCRAWGATAEEALHNLEGVATDFIASCQPDCSTRIDRRRAPPYARRTRGGASVDFEPVYTPEQRAFRTEVRDWLDDHVPHIEGDQDSDENYAKYRQLGRELGEQG